MVSLELEIRLPILEIRDGHQSSSSTVIGATVVMSAEIVTCALGQVMHKRYEIYVHASFKM